MKLYHGSNTIIEQIDLSKCKFVMANRSKRNVQPTHSFDIVIGPVANDTMATLFRNFDDGIIDLQKLVNGLKYKKVSSQYLFHSADAIKSLRRI